MTAIKTLISNKVAKSPQIKLLFKLSLAISSVSLLANCATAELINNPNPVRIINAHASTISTDRSVMRSNTRSNTSNSNVNHVDHSHNPTFGNRQGFYERHQQASDTPSLAVEERRVIKVNGASLPYDRQTDLAPPKVDFETWLNAVPGRRQHALAYQQHIANYVGATNLPPLSEILATARDWYKCGFDPYEVPPRHLWDNNLKTFYLYSVLRQRGILPPTTQIRSVYRNEALNRCAGGAAASQHVMNSGIDIWVPEYEDNPWQISQLQDRLCQFRLEQGAEYDFGLGLYPANAYHIDTHRVRIWGAEHTPIGSSCRIPLQKVESDETM